MKVVKKKPIGIPISSGGAGISGLCAAYYIQKEFPDKKIAILERRMTLGGTWAFFKYPGFRSDSDMYSFAYSFRPWSKSARIAMGDDILDYLNGVAKDYKIREKILYGHGVSCLSFSTEEAKWTVTLDAGGQLSANFVYACSGYYDYAEGYTPEFDGIDTFKGLAIHAQDWRDDIEYAGKQVAHPLTRQLRVISFHSRWLSSGVALQPSQLCPLWGRRQHM